MTERTLRKRTTAPVHLHTRVAFLEISAYAWNQCLHLKRCGALCVRERLWAEGYRGRVEKRGVRDDGTMARPLLPSSFRRNYGERALRHRERASVGEERPAAAPAGRNEVSAPKTR